MKKAILLGTILTTLVFGLFYYAPAQASNLQNAFGSALNTAAGNSGAGFNVEQSQSLEERVATVIKIILSFVGVIFLILIIYSGIRWMTAGGNDQTLDKAKETLRQAIMGLILIIGAYAISIFVFNSLK